MTYIKESIKDFDTLCEDLSISVKDNNFGVLHIHDLKATLNSKGIEFKNQCKIYEVCNPSKANEVLAMDMSLNMALPCRISIWEEDGVIKIGAIKPSSVLSSLTTSLELQKISCAVDEIIKNIIDDAINY